MRFFLTIISLSLFFTACKSPKDLTNLMRKDVYEIAGDAYEGRGTGSLGEKKAAVYLTKRFKQSHLIPLGNETYLQAFNFQKKSGPHAQVEFSEGKKEGYVTGNNIIGFYDNKALYTVVIGAHYDHLGYGEENSLYRGNEPMIHNGADDNASGVANVLALAKRAKLLPKNNNYLFILFSGEELGLLGSNYFSKNPTIGIETINYMINMDMVGRLKEDRSLAVYGVGTSPLFKSALEKTNAGFKLMFHESGVGPSDHTSFYLLDKPVLHFFTGQHEDYHKPTDDPEKLNFLGMKSIVEFIEKILIELDDDGKIPFTKTKNESDSPRFKVTLGVVPDYLYDGKGMRIDGVSEGKPAYKAGLKKGDVVIGLGQHLITDMQSYMKALGNFEKGSKTQVQFLREGKELNLEVEF